MIKTSSSVQYYSVRGTTADAIFDDMKRNGLFDNKGRRAFGVTSAKWSMDWNRIETTRPAVCSAESMTILLNLVETLPQHDQLNDLSRASEPTGSDSPQALPRMSSVMSTSI